jgi:hypothetical protein
MIFSMKRPLFFKALIFGLSAGALILTSCETTESRISEHPDLFNTLSPRDQELVRQGQIRTGMSQNAVWLAWGAPAQKAVGVMHGHETETWIYVYYASYGYGYGYGYPYGPWGYPYGFGFGGVAFVHHHHHGHSFVLFGDPFYDPFYYSYIPPSVPVPYRTCTFSGNRVVSFQYLKD